MSPTCLDAVDFDVTAGSATMYVAHAGFWAS